MSKLPLGELLIILAMYFAVIISNFMLNIHKSLSINYSLEEAIRYAKEPSNEPGYPMRSIGSAVPCEHDFIIESKKMGIDVKR